MAFAPISQTTPESDFQPIQLIATDMDGTLTINGQFTAGLLQALEKLNQANIPVLVVTGRSAGWVSAVVNYLPVWGAIAENGGIFSRGDPEPMTLLTPIPDLNTHRQELAKAFKGLQARFPGLQESADNRFRITDWTFDVAGLSDDTIQEMDHLCQEWGWSFTYSTVQCHIKPYQQDKATGLLEVLRQHFPQLSRDVIVTVGDSPNDETLFDRSYFPRSVGVANVQHYRDRLKHQPTYVTLAAEGAGFAELADYLIRSRGLAGDRS